MITPGSELDAIERSELLAERKSERRYLSQLSRHPDPRDPDYPGPDEDEDDASLRTCLSCNLRHPFNADGTPVGGALPCGH